jgi:hypothetical protein
MQKIKIYDQYQKYGVKDYYKLFSNQYQNPHEVKIDFIFKKYLVDLISRNTTILDIACGDGLITRLVNHYNQNYNIEGTDPYFSNKYTRFNYSFEDIALGKMNNYHYDLVTCCYAFHLIDNTWKYDFLSQLALITDKFIIITPSKKINFNHPLWKFITEIREEKITLIVLENVSQ